MAAFLDGLSATRPLGLAGVSIERVFQRDDRREMFGFLDGVRNVRSSQRHAAIYVDREVSPEEPGWTEDGSDLPDRFEVVFQRWMLDPRFPTDGAGADLLFGNGMVSLEQGSLFFAPPHDRRFLGASLFDPPRHGVQ